MGGGVGEEGREQWPEEQLHWQVGPPLPLICDALDYVGLGGFARWNYNMQCIDSMLHSCYIH